MKEHTTVVIGCSTTEDYAFLLPLTCLLWRELVGYEPLALLVGSRAVWSSFPHGALVLATLEEHRIAHEFLPVVLGYPDHTIAQNCRQHAVALDRFQPSDWIVPSDADLWPLRRSFYHQHEGTSYRVVCYYSNGDHFNLTNKDEILALAERGLGSATLPTCHVAMRAGDWSALYQPKRGDVSGSIKRSLETWLPSRTGRPASMSLWMSDQQLMTEKVCQQPWFPAHALMIERIGHPPMDRLDRSHSPWPKVIEPEQWTDAHMHRTPWSDVRWEDCLNLVKTFLPERTGVAQAYHRAWVRA